MGKFENWPILNVSDERLEELLARTFIEKNASFDLITEIRKEGEGGASQEAKEFYFFEDLFYSLLELRENRRMKEK